MASWLEMNFSVLVVGSVSFPSCSLITISQMLAALR